MSETEIKPALYFAVRALVQFQQELEYVPATKRTEKVTRQLVDNARQIRKRIEQELGLESEEYSGALSSGRPDGLSAVCTYVDVFTSAGVWLNRCWELAPRVMSELHPTQSSTPPFGFAARPHGKE